MKQKLLIKTMLLLLCLIVGGSSAWADTTVSYGWENADDATAWTITDAITKTSGQGNTGSYAGKINTNHTYVQFKEKVYVKSFSFAFKRTSNNSNYNVYIETSTDGSTWTAAETYTMGSFNNGSYLTKTKTFDGKTQYYVRFHCYNTTAVRYVDDVSITYSTGDSSDPSISADDVGIAYNATSGSIAYSIENGGGNVSAEVTSGDWLTLGEITSSEVPFTCLANTSTTPRNAKVTLFFEGASNKVVTVTQAAAPYANIAALTANTETKSYNVTLTDAVVTYVNGNYAYIQDASGAVVLYKSGHGLTAGDVFNGTATVAYQLKNNNPQITDISGVTPTSGSAPAPTTIAQSAWAYTFTNVLSQYFKITDATITQSNSKYYVSLGGENIQLYKASNSISSLDLTKKYNIVGFPTLYSSTKEIQIFADPEVVISPTITVASSLAVPNYVVGTAEPTYETLTVNGSNLTADITLSLGESSNFEMSSDLYKWTNSLTLTQSEGSVTDAEVAIRLKAGLSKGAYEGTLTLSSTGVENAEVSLSGSVTGTTYTIEQYTTPATAHGTITFSPSSPVEDGTEVTLSAEPAEGYTFTADSWVIYKQSGEDYVVDNSVTVTDSKIVMPAYAIWVDGTFAAKPTYAVTCVADPVAGGTIEASPASAYEGQTVTLSYLAETGYELAGIVITKTEDGSATGITPAVSGDDYTFTMPGYAVTATATFEEIIDYVTLPFEFDGGLNSIGTTLSAGTKGLMQSGLGSDYGSKPYLKFDGTGDYVILKVAEAPGKLTFNIKGNSFSGGTFKVQTSVDGETYTDLESYTSLGDTQSEEFTNLAASVRYIKWIYTKKSSGNVALGNIGLQKAPPATPTFTVAEGEYDEVKNVELSCATDGATIYYTTNGDTPTSSSTEYTGGISITETTTLKAIAVKDEVASAVASATYTMNRPAAPTFDVAAFVFDAAFDVHLSTETDGATIYYTTDGSTPTNSSNEYTDKGISINTGSDVTVKAIAFKSGLTSDVANVTYTFDARVTPTFSLTTTSLNLKVNDASDAVTVTTNSDGEVAFTCEDAHVTLTGTGNSRTISANAAGTYTVNVSVTGSATYKDAAGTITVTVTKKATTMVISNVFDDGLDLHYAHGGVTEGIVKYNDVALNPQPTVTFTSSDEKVATVDEEGNIAFKKAGTTTITASYAGDDEYEASNATYVLDLIDTTPQAIEVDITLNNTFFGCTAFTSWTTGMATSLSGETKNVTVTYGKGTSGNMYCNSEKVRFYSNNTFTIDAPIGYNIISVDMNVSISSATPSGKVSSDTWTGNASSVSFTFDNKTDITSISVTLAPVVTLNKYGYATYCSVHPIDFSKAEGFTAWRVSDVSADGTITFSKITETIKEGQGVLLYNKDADDENKTTVTLPVGESEGATEFTTSENKLVGITEPTAIAADQYFGLSGNKFVKVNAGTVPAGKALLPASAITNAARELTFVFEGETTVIRGIENSEMRNEKSFFDLQGRKVAQPKKGLYIMNGKKVIMK